MTFRATLVVAMILAVLVSSCEAKKYPLPGEVWQLPDGRPLRVDRSTCYTYEFWTHGSVRYTLVDGQYEASCASFMASATRQELPESL